MQSESLENEIVEKTAIDGLEWRANYVARSGPDSYYVIQNPGPGVTDILFYSEDIHESWYGVHIGQIDRITFLGDLDNTIRGTFLDCRFNSPTLHQKIELTFKPDPTKHLYISPGIAHAFSGLKNITVRNESIWFMAENNPDYDLANDTFTFRIDEDPSNFPCLVINRLPIPDEVLHYILSEQQQAIREGRHRSFSTRTLIGGDIKYVKISPIGV